jgi:mRNA-degrading endonuclease RelE of RelBE toxin-antitoxin system
MRKYLLLVLLIWGCMSPQQNAANRAAEDYVRHMLDNPKHLESVSFTSLVKKRYTTALDSALNYASIKGDDHKKIKKFVDSQNDQRPDLVVNNLKDLDNIERGKLTYYLLIYTFKIDSGGHKRVRRYRFELDSVNNVLKATDISHVRNMTE